jgi:hypothetical protein
MATSLTLRPWAFRLFSVIASVCRGIRMAAAVDGQWDD